MKLYGEPSAQPIEFSSGKLKDILVELGFPPDNEARVKELLNDIMLVSGLAKVQTSDGKITIEQTCE